MDIYGPFEATKNDATIVMVILKTDSELATLFVPNDMFVVDIAFIIVLNSYKTNLDLKQWFPNF